MLNNIPFSLLELASTHEDGNVTHFIDVNEDVWVMKVVERYSGDSLSLSLTVSTIDKQEESVAQVIIGV